MYKIIRILVEIKRFKIKISLTKQLKTLLTIIKIGQVYFPKQIHKLNTVL